MADVKMQPVLGTGFSACSGFKNKPLECLWAHWSSLPRANGFGVPMRRALNVSDLSDILPRLSLMRRMGPYNVTVGLVGTAVDALWDHPIAGMNAFDLTAPSMRENAERFYTALLSHPSAAVIREHVQRGPGRTLEVSTLYLPMCDREGDAVYIVGCSVFASASSPRALADHLITDCRQLAGIEFLDIGNGVPTVDFADMDGSSRLKTRVHARDESWWRRFLPSGIKAREGRRRSDA